MYLLDNIMGLWKSQRALERRGGVTMCSGCAGSYEDGDEELGERGLRREATAFGMSSGAGGAHEWPDKAASIRTDSRPAQFAAFEETYDVVVGAEHLVEVRVVRANALVTPALTSPASAHRLALRRSRARNIIRRCRLPLRPTSSRRARRRSACFSRLWQWFGRPLSALG
jgi:hypothetical protein